MAAPKFNQSEVAAMTKPRLRINSVRPTIACTSKYWIL